MSSDNLLEPPPVSTVRPLFPSDKLDEVPASYRTMGDLVRYADAIPPHRVKTAIVLLAARLDEIGDADARQTRLLVVIGALTNRALFELAKLPCDPTVLIG